MDENYAIIYVQPFKFEIRPCPAVKVGFEPLILVINWDGNVGLNAWSQVDVQNFTRDNATLDPVANFQSNPSFVPAGPDINLVTFPSTPPLGDYCYKYELVFRRGSEVYILDPTMLIRRLA